MKSENIDYDIQIRIYSSRDTNVTHKKYKQKFHKAFFIILADFSELGLKNLFSIRISQFTYMRPSIHLLNIVKQQRCSKCVFV